LANALILIGLRNRAKQRPRQTIRVLRLAGRSVRAAGISAKAEQFDFHSCGMPAVRGRPRRASRLSSCRLFMRHGSITLTMEPHGHLFPGQEADGAARLHAMLSPSLPGNERRERTATPESCRSTRSARRCAHDAIHCRTVPSRTKRPIRLRRIKKPATSCNVRA